MHPKDKAKYLINKFGIEVAKLFVLEFQKELSEVDIDTDFWHDVLYYINKKATD